MDMKATLCSRRLDNNGTSQNLLVTLPNHTPMTCTGKKTGKDLFLYRFFLVLILFPSILNLVHSSHCKCENLMGAKNSKQLRWHNTVAIREATAQFISVCQVKQPVLHKGYQKEQAKLHIKIAPYVLPQKSISFLSSWFEFTLCTSAKWHLLLHTRGVFLGHCWASFALSQSVMLGL